MITVYPYKELGHVNHGWLNARHHFSFASYHNPKRMEFGLLRVINDDIIKAGAGFDTHPHRDMEIITYVRKGAISHRDSEGNEGRTAAGDVQVMSAGSGIFHSEFNQEDEDTSLYQIWIHPSQKRVKPRWDTYTFPKAFVKSSLPLLVSGDKDAPLFIYQDARIYGGRLQKNTVIHHPITHQAYILISEGEVEIEGKKLQKGDGAEITDTTVIDIKSLDDAEILVIDVPSA